MKEIVCTNDIITLVDDEDYEYLNQFKWTATITNYETYLITRHDKEAYKNKKIDTIYMPRVIMKTPKHLEVDHVFHNTLDNRKFIEVDGIIKKNLRNCTHAQNSINRNRISNTGYRGVCYHKGIGKYTMQITINGKLKHLGVFDDPIEAARKYDKYALKYQGEYAILNFKE